MREMNAQVAPEHFCIRGVWGRRIHPKHFAGITTADAQRLSAQFSQFISRERVGHDEVAMFCIEFGQAAAGTARGFGDEVRAALLQRGKLWVENGGGQRQDVLPVNGLSEA